MPDGGDYPALRHGQTLRQALAALRAADWGDLGGTFPLPLSDGTWLEVELTPASDGGGSLMGSQRVARLEQDRRLGERVVRYYAI